MPDFRQNFLRDFKAAPVVTVEPIAVPAVVEYVQATSVNDVEAPTQPLV